MVGLGRLQPNCRRSTMTTNPYPCGASREKSPVKRPLFLTRTPRASTLTRKNGGRSRSRLATAATSKGFSLFVETVCQARQGRREFVLDYLSARSFKPLTFFRCDTVRTTRSGKGRQRTDVVPTDAKKQIPHLLLPRAKKGHVCTRN